MRATVRPSWLSACHAQTARESHAAAKPHKLYHWSNRVGEWRASSGESCAARNCVDVCENDFLNQERRLQSCCVWPVRRECDDSQYVPWRYGAAVGNLVFRMDHGCGLQ